MGVAVWACASDSECLELGVVTKTRVKRYRASLNPGYGMHLDPNPERVASGLNPSGLTESLVSVLQKNAFLRMWRQGNPTDGSGDPSVHGLNPGKGAQDLLLQMG